LIVTFFSSVGGGANGGVPSTIIDQIQLWENERTRFKLTRARLFEFDTTQKQEQRKFDYLQNWAKKEGLLLLSRQDKKENWILAIQLQHPNTAHSLDVILQKLDRQFSTKTSHVD
jgi:hypothetical protein